MLITSKFSGDRTAMFAFLRMMGVLIHDSVDFQALGRIGLGGNLIGVVGYNGFTDVFAQIHSAGLGNWVSREFITQAFTYPFVQLGLKYLIAPVAASNAQAMKFDRKMGFTHWATLPDGYAEGDDLILLKMHRQDCRWINSTPFARGGAMLGKAAR